VGKVRRCSAAFAGTGLDFHPPFFTVSPTLPQKQQLLPCASSKPLFPHFRCDSSISPHCASPHCWLSVAAVVCLCSDGCKCGRRHLAAEAALSATGDRRQARKYVLQAGLKPWFSSWTMLGYVSW